MRLRLRQICLVAAKLAPVTEDFRHVLDLEVCHVDPSVGRWGLENALWPIGNGFLEVVAPVEEGTAAGRYLERRKGDGGYMVILQTSEAGLAAARERMAAHGVRTVADIDRGEYRGMQLHPRDTGGAILSIDCNEPDPADPDSPAGPWHPAGTKWRDMAPSRLVRGMRAAELQSPDPEALAQRWSALLDLPMARDAHGRPCLHLDDAVLRFVPDRDGRGEGLGSLDIAVADRDEILARARQRNLPTADDVVTVCGTRFKLV